MLAAATALCTRLGASPGRWKCAQHEHMCAAIRAKLDTATFATAWAAGQELRLEEAVRYALDVPG